MFLFLLLLFVRIVLVLVLIIVTVDDEQNHLAEETLVQILALIHTVLFLF